MHVQGECSGSFRQPTGFRLRLLGRAEPSTLAAGTGLYMRSIAHLDRSNGNFPVKGESLPHLHLWATSFLSQHMEDFSTPSRQPTADSCGNSRPAEKFSRLRWS